MSLELDVPPEQLGVANQWEEHPGPEPGCKRVEGPPGLMRQKAAWDPEAAGVSWWVFL